MKFLQNPSNGSLVVLCGEVDGHDEANSRFSLFREGAQLRKPLRHNISASRFRGTAQELVEQNSLDSTC
jgi:hypothetical protein